MTRFAVLPSKALRGMRCCAGRAQAAGRRWNILGAAVAALDGSTPRQQAHPVLQRESGISILGILALVLVRLAGAQCEPALPVNEST
jgi:hypothetical protein